MGIYLLLFFFNQELLHPLIEQIRSFHYSPYFYRIAFSHAIYSGKI